MQGKGLNIIYEDQYLIAVEKPAGLLTMSTGKKQEVTAYSILYDYISAGHGMQRRKYGQGIFIVHRLDRETSGVIIFAKDAETKRMLQEGWNELVLERSYTAMLEGEIEDEEGWIETWVYENRKSMKVHCYPIEERDIVAAREGRCRFAERNGWQYASSHCRKKGTVIIDEKTYTFVEFTLETGRKNQIRVHSQWIGHPVAGDKKYEASSNPIGRLALHAHKLTLIHPWTKKTLKFKANLPKSMIIPQV